MIFVVIRLTLGSFAVPSLLRFGLGAVSVGVAINSASGVTSFKST